MYCTKRLRVPNVESLWPLPAGKRSVRPWPDFARQPVFLLKWDACTPIDTCHSDTSHAVTSPVPNTKSSVQICSARFAVYKLAAPCFVQCSVQVRDRYSFGLVLFMFLSRDLFCFAMDCNSLSVYGVDSKHCPWVSRLATVRRGLPEKNIAWML